MDLNLYLGLPPLPRPPGRLGASMDCPAPAAATPAPEAPRTDDALAAGTGSPAPEETPPPSPPVVHWPSNALSMPVMSPIDPMLVDWLDGVSTDSEETLDAGELAAASDAASDDVDVSPPPLPAAAAASWVIPVPEALGMDEPAELPAPEDLLPLPLVDSPPERWEMDFSWFDGPGTDSEEALDAGDQALVFDALSDDSNLSPPPMSPLPLAELEGVHLEWVERLSHPDRAAPAAGAEMVSTRQSIGGAIEDTTPELRLQRLIQVSEQHRIVRPGPVSRNQRATSPEAERLAQAIQRSHSSLDASRRPNLDSDGKMGGTVAVKKDGDCGCNSSFECNICLDAAKEPVVTPCGHLFCWPCLYQWLHGHSVHSECPVCKGEVLEVNVTPIYGRGGGERDASSNDVPPRPSANRSESMRQQQLQMPNPRGIASMVRQLIANQDHLRGPTAPPVGGVEVTVLPEGGTRIRRIVDRRQQRPVLASPSIASPSPILRRVRRAVLEGGTRVRLPSSNADNAAPAVPQQSSSVEQASTSSTVAVIVGQAAQSRRSRPPSEPTTARRTRRRQQH